MARRFKRKVTWALATVGLLVAVLVWTLAGGSSVGGDPGSKVMDQLTPTVSALPGYATGSLAWVKQLPESLGASYAVKIEPFQDSCDGMAGTQGWSQVVVQAGFTWTKGFAALVSYMDPRLTKLGWSAVRYKRVSYPPSQNWIKTLRNGSRASVNVSQGLGDLSSHWQLDAVAKPVGKAAGGC
jgi:hypothetical protein